MDKLVPILIIAGLILLNALFVALSRASGMPARDLYGIRVAPSAFGYKSLGAGSEVVTKAQHCRAEVWLDAHGWVPVDPADVRRALDERVRAVPRLRRTLVRTPPLCGRPIWVDDPGFSAGDHVREVTCPGPADDDAPLESLAA